MLTHRQEMKVLTITVKYLPLLLALMYFITGLGDKGTILQSGPDQGMDKYWRNVLKYSLPFWRDYRRITEFAESDVMFGVYEDQQLK